MQIANGDGAGLLTSQHIAIHFRHYLHVLIADHRKSLTQLLLSDHLLAEVQLRYSDRHQPSVPRHWQLCLFCRNEVEDTCHAMFVCEQSNDLVVLCTAFLTSVIKIVPALQRNSDYKSFL